MRVDSGIVNSTIGIDMRLLASTDIALRVLMLLGRQDYTTPSTITAQWMDRLRAPKKSIVWMEHSAHLPMIEEPGHVLSALLERARPLAAKSKTHRRAVMQAAP